MHPAVASLAQADFSGFADRFANAGFQVRLPAKGMLQVTASNSTTVRPAVLLSVGVHGDETGPIELLAHLLDDLADKAQALAVDLLVVVGNIAAIAAGKRYLDADLNRMFRNERSAVLNAAREAERADQMMRATTAFFSQCGPHRWHLDLHTAIRPSSYPRFAIVPDIIPEAARKELVTLLGNGDIGAIIRNPKSAGTYSYFTSEHCQAAGTTVELGRVGVLGQNDLQQFAAMSAAINSLLRGDASLMPQAAEAPHVFLLAQEIMKLSNDFKMSFDSKTQNFTSLAQGALIAEDGDTRYVVKHAEEFVVFPNPNVQVGQRAGLMVVREGAV
ncbi:MAG: succinylglutamate desuccinylase [Burkholderiales bacterium]|nr:succinylglutamate desuccinylase [Burkholderiales bacterium]